MFADTPDQLALCVCSPSARMLKLLCIVPAAVVDCVPGTHLPAMCLLVSSFLSESCIGENLMIRLILGYEFSQSGPTH